VSTQYELITYSGLTNLIDAQIVFTRHSCTGRYCWERVLAMGILSVRPSVRLSVTTRYKGEIETPGLHRMIAQTL